MKKVLFLIHDMGQGGAEKVLVNLVNHMDHSKFDITVMTLFDSGENRQFLKKSIRYRTWCEKMIPGNSHLMKMLSSERLHKLIVKERYDIEVAYLEGPCARVISGCNDPGVKKVAWIHIEQHTAERAAESFRTELIAEYMVRKLGYDYNMDALLDMIDSYMDNIRAKCTWGYSTPYFIAGCYSAHVNNVTYLTQKSSIRSKDIRFILNKIGAAARKRYPYDLLEKTYLGYLQSDIDDSEAMSKLKNVMKGKNVVVIAPGQTATAQCSLIQKYIEENNAVVIMVNFVHDEIMGDFVYMSNVKRYRYWIHTEKFQASHKILTSNIIDENVNDKDTFVVSFAKLVKCGWEHLDNSSIMLLRLLDAFELKQLAIAGLDGYHYFADGKLNYVNQELELSNVKENPMELNQEIQDMLKDFMKSRKQKYNIRFITESRFSSIVE